MVRGNMRVTRLLVVAVIILAPLAGADGEPSETQEAAPQEGSGDAAAPPSEAPSAPVNYSAESSNVSAEGSAPDSVDAEAQVDADLSAATQNEQAQAAAAAADGASSSVDGPRLVILLDEVSEVHVAAGGSAQSSGGADESSSGGGYTVGGYVSILGAAAPPASVEPFGYVPSVPDANLPSPQLWLASGPSDATAYSTSGEPRSESSQETSLAAAAIDASALPVTPLALTAVLAATTVLASAGVSSSGGFGLAGLKKFLARLLPAGAFGLFTRLSGDQLLDHPRRGEIYEYVRQNPGERLEVARKALGLSNGPMLHHLRILDQGDLVRVVRDDGMARLYPAGPRVQPSTYLLPIRRRLLDELRVRPGITQREIARLTGLSERVVSYHVGWLNSNGLLDVQRTGASKRCFASAPLPPGASPR
jgi:winged helix-turn-helix DNA-binding protein